MKPIVKVPVQNGLIAGLLGAALAIGLYYMGRHPFLFPVFLDFRIFLLSVFVFFTLKEFRENYGKGILYFSQGVIISSLFVFTFGVIASGAIGIFATVVPSFLGDYIALSIQQLKALPADALDKLEKEIYERNLEMLPSTNVFDLVSLYFWQTLMIGVFVTIILSVVLRRQPKN